MGFSQEAGYTPQTISEIMSALRVNINNQFGTSYTSETFVGTNFYKYFYALAQRMQESEIKTSEIFLRLQQYIETTNERISRPVVTNPGLIAKIEGMGYQTSVKKPVDADAGKVFIAVDIDETGDEYAAQKLEICKAIKDSTVAGVVTQGDQVETLVLSNGQSFDFKYDLPNRITIHLRLTITLSANNQLVVGSPDDVKFQLMQNISERYRMGNDFAPKKYFAIEDAPWASDVLLEWSDDNELTYNSTVYSSAYDDLFQIALERITIVEA